MISKYSNYFETSLNKNVNIKLLKQIQGLNLCKDKTTFNNKSNKHELYLFHLINDYHLAYTKSKDEEKAYRTNTLESYGKRNDNRQKRFNENEKIINNKSKSPKDKLTATYENLILDLILKRKRKFANVILAFLFIHKEISFYIQKHLFLNTKTLETIFEAQKDALNFFEFTYISRGKIAHSCLICIYTYLTKVAKVDERIALKFTEEIRKLLFLDDAVHKLLKSNLKLQIFCDGIYNSTPIFHWYTPRDKKCYTDKDLEDYLKATNQLNNEAGIFKKIIHKIFLKNQISIEEFDKYLSEKDKFEEVLLGLCEAYVRNPNKLMEHFLKNEKKTLKYYLYSPFRLLRTIFLYLNTKSTH